MKILGLQGSPRQTGNTATILNWVAEELEKMGHEVEIESVRSDYKGCQACYYCKKYPDEIKCKVDTDIYEMMVDADAIIFATPLYCWSFSSPIKNIIDRSLCLVDDYLTENHRSLIQNKNYGLIVTAAGPVEGNMDPIRAIFKRYLYWIKGVNAAEFLAAGCTKPDELNPEFKELASKFAQDLVGEGEIQSPWFG